tara:strand:- start:9604 stop:9780 length:177 start_codon:yes stop_codon:yes gene_type:complete
MKYIIIDWANNRLFPNKEFNSLDNALEFRDENIDNSLFEKTQNENYCEYQDIYIVKKD